MYLFCMMHGVAFRALDDVPDPCRRFNIGVLEDAEKIECLRYLENGIPLRMALTDYIGVSIDTPEDLEKAKTLL